MVTPNALLNRIGQLSLQYELASYALTHFAKSTEAANHYASAQLENLQNVIKKAEKFVDFDVKSHWAFSADSQNEYVKATKSSLPTRIEAMANRLLQNQLILLVAVFESFMKDIHREILLQNPGHLRGDRKIPLGKLVKFSREEIIEEEIQREVQSLDRKNVRERAEYFAKLLDMHWLSEWANPWERALDLRNKVLHEDPDAQVTDADLHSAYLFCTNLPLACVLKGSVLYPDGFEWSGVDSSRVLEEMETKARNLSENHAQPCDHTDDSV